MRRRPLRRVVLGVLFALPMAAFPIMLARATGSPQAQGGGPPACETCHAAFVDAWSQGAHGRAAQDPAFREAWQAQGRPSTCMGCHTTGYDPATGMWQGDGVRCEACHGPIANDHPAEPMPTDRSADLCGSCHLETRFEWQVSKHRQVELACIGCHDPHATTLRADSPSDLCAKCHRERASNFAHSAHSQQGLSCGDCHLGPTDSGPGEGHAQRDHSFNVRLSTCNTCHVYQMHNPVQTQPGAENAAQVMDLASTEASGLSAEPSPVSPVGFATLAGLVGMATGMILAPWLERWYRRLRDENE